MLIGTKYYNVKSRLWAQEKDGWEQVLQGLQLCGPTAASNARATLVDVDEGKSGFGGDWVERPADALATFFATPANWPAFQSIRPLPLGWGPGLFVPWEIPQYYEYAIKRVFGLIAKFEYGTFENIVDYLKQGCAVQLCLVTPGHFISAVAYDDSTQEILFKDPWGQDRWPGGNSVPDENGNKRFKELDYRQNINQWFIKYNKV
jgi:hypothetical protein